MKVAQTDRRLWHLFVLAVDCIGVRLHWELTVEFGLGSGRQQFKLITLSQNCCELCRLNGIIPALQSNRSGSSHRSFR